MPVKTLRDVTGGSTPAFLPVSTDAQGNVSCGPTNSTIWYLPLGAMAVAFVLVAVLHPPLLMMVVIDVVICALNFAAVMKAGYRNVPGWVWFVVGLQGLQTLRDILYLLR